MDTAGLSIEGLCVLLHILAGVALATDTTTQGRSRDFEHWLQIFYMIRPEQWKA